MPSHLIAYVVVVLGLFLIPGPAVLLVLTRSLAGGARVGVATGLGVASGDLIHTILATIGLSAILSASALAFGIVKYAGVAYLLYLGLRAWTEKSDGLALRAARLVAPALAFQQAVAAELLNPKTAMFFLAFLPQFTQAGRGPAVLQLAELGLIFVAMSALYTTLIALAAGRIGGWLHGRRAIGRWRGRAVGAIFLALGARLALQAR